MSMLLLVAVALAVNVWTLYCLHVVIDQTVAIRKLVTSTEETAIDLHKMMVETHAIVTALNHDLRDQ